VPGPIGAPRIALVHGGERIAEPGGGGAVYNFYLDGMAIGTVDQFVDSIHSALLRKRKRAGALGLN